MRRVCGHLTLDVPDTLEDETFYAFEQRPFDRDAGGAPAEASVSFEAMPERVTPAAMIASVRDGVERFPGVDAVFTEGEARAGAAEARTLHAALGGGLRHLFVAAFRWPGALMASIRFETDHGDAEPVFEHAVASVDAVDAGVAPAPGFARRPVGRFSLELPRDLAPPETYRFVSPDERTSLVIAVEHGPMELEPAFDAWISLGIGDVLDVQAVPVEEARVVGHLLLQEGAWHVDQWTETGDVLASRWFRVARVRLADGRGVRVLLSEAESSRAGDARWAEIVTSLRLTAAAH